MLRLLLSVLTISLLQASLGRGDQFDAIDGKAIREGLQGSDVKGVDRLSMNDLASLPNLLKESRSTLLFLKTTKGNLTRLLVSPELRKPEAGGEPYPVFLIERFDTFDIEDLGSRIARGREIALFPGFLFDFDTGQVVPADKGEDLALVSKDELALVAKGTSKLYVVNKLPAPDPNKPPQPTPGRTVVPRDFAGRYRLFANGQFSGTLDLRVNNNAEVSGSFRSDTQGASYPVSGQVATEHQNKVTLNVKFPRSKGEFEGYLWTDGKGAIAGTFRLNERPFGFFAIREGSKFAPEGADISVVTTGDTPTLTVVINSQGYSFDGKEHTLEGLLVALKAKPSKPRPKLVLRAPAAASYESILKVIDSVKAAGFNDISISTIE
jgi:hypothetical protein